MNPSMLEASDDLTNLSHLNEPAGALYTTPSRLVVSGQLTSIVLLQSSRQFAFDMRRRKFTPTVE